MTDALSSARPPGPRARPAPAPSQPRCSRTPLRASAGRASGARREQRRPFLPIRGSPASAGNPAAAWHRHKRGRRRRWRGEVPGGRRRAAALRPRAPRGDGPGRPLPAPSGAGYY
ncbi:translation initiation factor IF-2-like [Pipra filicauda]|uniref:Translation initiation factor IF-2-like n=1 Tax=Pipra filicauda TaxID=649802 RepID=A0A7R5K3E8_9PASS|nr:translation initiation factor IF-2-like [Pipra filicauda]